MTRGIVSTASVSIHAPRERVWSALTDPVIIAKYMFGSTVTSDWTVGSSPLSGQPDVPENYHELTYILTDAGDRTRLELSQDNNGSPDEAKHSAANWSQMLEALKSVVESTP